MAIGNRVSSMFIHKYMIIQQKLCPNMHFPLNFGTKTHAIGHTGRTVSDLASNP